MHDFPLSVLAVLAQVPADGDDLDDDDAKGSPEQELKVAQMVG